MRKMFSRRPRGLAVLGFAVAVAVFIADQISKHVILRVVDLDRIGQIQVLDPWFNLTMVWNRGVSFGLFQADSLWQRAILIALSLVISGFLALWMFNALRRLQAISFGMIIGGAIGNVVDRVAYGAVADFLDFSGLYFPFVFNVADAGISVGVAVLLLDAVLNDDERRGARL
jgi:signal peptidase II